MKIMIPPMAVTHDSIAVVWDKPTAWKDIKEYQVNLNGRAVDKVSATDYTFEHLTPKTQYEIQILAISRNGKLLKKSEKLKGVTRNRPVICNITKYGAIGDGKTRNTAAIQRAIDECGQNGVVYIPKGIFLSGAIFLKSNMCLYVEAGGKLLGSIDPNDYPLVRYRYEGKEEICFASLVNTRIQEERHKNIMIFGKGEIDANGNALLVNELSDGRAKRGCAICLQNTDYIYMKDIKVRQSAFWCIHPIYCRYISINNIEVNTRTDENGERYANIFNGDGLDLDSCAEVHVFNSTITSQDDCLAIKSGKDEDGRSVGICSENIRISNCRFKAGFGIAMGSEMSGGVRDVRVWDCRFEDSFSIASLKAPRGRGAYIEDIVYDNCSLVNKDRSMKSSKWFKGALYVDNYYGEDAVDYETPQEISDTTPVIRNITFQNISIDTEEGYAVYIAGLPESNAQNICLNHIRAIGRKGLLAVNVDGLTMFDVAVEAREGRNMEFIMLRHYQNNGGEGLED